MEPKSNLKKLKKELAELQNSNMFSQDIYNQKVGEGVSYLGSVFFLVAGVGALILLVTCWDLMAPLLESQTDTRPFVLIFAILSLTIGIYQRISVSRRLKQISKQEINHHRRVNNISKKIIDSE